MKDPLINMRALHNYLERSESHTELRALLIKMRARTAICSILRARLIWKISRWLWELYTNICRTLTTRLMWEMSDWSERSLDPLIIMRDLWRCIYLEYFGSQIDLRDLLFNMTALYKLLKLSECQIDLRDGFVNVNDERKHLKHSERYLFDTFAYSTIEKSKREAQPIVLLLLWTWT